MKHSFLLLLLFLFASFSATAQVSFLIDDDFNGADLKIEIDEDQSFADIKLKIGEDISFADFTIGFAFSPGEADFVIRKYAGADYRIQAGHDVSFADIKIQAGEDVSFDDLKIEIRKTGTVDYLIYTEKAYISLEEIVIAILPAVNFHLKDKEPELTKLFRQ